MNKGLTMKKTILASLVSVAAMCSAQVFAQTAPEARSEQVVAQPAQAARAPTVTAAPTAAAAPTIEASVERPTVTSNLSSEQRKMLMDYVQNNDELNGLAHKERVLDYEAKLSKLELEKLKAEQERDVLLGKAIAPPAPSANTGANGAQGQGKSQAHNDEDEEDEINPLDQIFITKVYGLDNNLRVTVYYKGTILQMRAGDVVADGIRMVRVFDNAAIFAKGKETRRVSMTTGENALSKAFEDERENEEDMPSMATPMGFVPPMMEQ